MSDVASAFLLFSASCFRCLPLSIERGQLEPAVQRLALGGLVIIQCAACKAVAETYLETRPTGAVEQELFIDRPTLQELVLSQRLQNEIFLRSKKPVSATCTKQVVPVRDIIHRDVDATLDSCSTSPRPSQRSIWSRCRPAQKYLLLVLKRTCEIRNQALMLFS